MSAKLLSQRDAPIIAVATAPGRGAVGIVRASGQGLDRLIQAVLRRPLKPRHATYGPFFDADGAVIDQGLALHFPAPHSYTGEDVLELQAHGGPVVLQLLLARCLRALPAARLAEPGEFTQRAYFNDKLDLAQAEAVADLIDASTEAAARSAGRSLAGEFSRRVDELTRRTVRLRTLVEATLDFPEEEIDFLHKADASGQLSAIRQSLADVLRTARQGALLRDGLRVVLAGQPNVGKSSLLNALAGAELAIVTPVPGTTRDRVSESIQIEGVPLHITDTAGLRGDEQAADAVERIGISRSWGAIVAADLVLFLHDLTRLDEAAYQAQERQIEARLPEGVARLDVYNKADAPSARPPADGCLVLSAQTGQGLQGLRQALLERAGWQAATEGLVIARARHVQALQRAAAHLQTADEQLQQTTPELELLAEELRQAHESLGEITGHFTPDDMLGEIFSRFCIGK
ncbi:MAG: tRNA uridine-5-carboxymethylaminomethyl(34) synthesis GTPase MnmE [Rubrivivax sp.]|nr:tRNA uridine-5-carboxymethylaminomethyl(34) synthesis GTPase MnmE [Rubrivivax sp.]